MFFFHRCGLPLRISLQYRRSSLSNAIQKGIKEDTKKNRKFFGFFHAFNFTSAHLKFHLIDWLIWWIAIFIPGCIATASIAQDKAYFEVKIQRDGQWGIGLSLGTVNVNNIPFGVDKQSWILREDGKVYHNNQVIGQTNDLPHESDVIVSHCAIESNYVSGPSTARKAVQGFFNTVQDWMEWSISLLSIERLIDWLIDWLIGNLLDWLIDWLLNWLIDWHVDWFLDRLIDWLIGQLIDWLR